MSLDILDHNGVKILENGPTHSILTTLVDLTLTFVMFLLVGAIFFYTTDIFVKVSKKTAPNFFGTFWSILSYVPIVVSLALWIGHTKPLGLEQLFLWLWIYWHVDTPLFFFYILAAWKGIKIVVHTFSYYFLTNPTQPPVNPTLTPQDVTVIVPTVGNFDEEFRDCITTILINQPARVIISTVGRDKHNQAVDVCEEFFPGLVKVVSIAEANKRAQFIHAINSVDTLITAYADDHVFWPPTYLRSCLAPLEDPTVGIVGTAKRVLRERGSSFVDSLLNYIACLYLERHNFECTASYNIEGGVFVISGRTAFVRTEILQSLEYRQGFLNETWWWGQVGPMKVDDDNYTTRFMVNHGFKTVFHNHPDAILETTLGTTGGIKKFTGQLIRWARTTWRSNPTSLFADRVCWTAYPWTTFAMFISSFFNFSLFYDPLLGTLLWYSNARKYMPLFLTLLFLSKLIKPAPHLWREPRDIGYAVFGIVFGYLHSAIKFWAMVTAGNIEWTGRQGIVAVGGVPVVVGAVPVAVDAGQAAAAELNNF